MIQHPSVSPLLYKTKFRTGTLVVRIFISALAVILVLTGSMAVVGMVLTQQSDTSSLVFVFLTLCTGFIIFKASGWTIRRYLVYNDRLLIRILGGIKTLNYPASSLKAFNDLKILVSDPSGGIGIVTTGNKIIKITELEIADFPDFIDHLQKLVKWDLNLNYDAKA